jgi:hypothetical protein
MTLSVTATQNGLTAPGMLLRVRVLTGCAATQNGATGFDQAAGLAAKAHLTTTETGSVIFGALMKKGEPGSFTALAGTILDDSLTDTGADINYGTCSAGATGTPGTVTVGTSAPAGAGQARAALAEILPDGTITEDTSAPAAVSSFTADSVTTDPFAPPAGSLLVALVASDQGGSPHPSVSGGGLTWTEKAFATASGYAGVWLAQA